MALDGLFLYKLVEELQNCVPGKINKIYQISNTELLFQLRMQGTKQNLMISAHTLYNRINVTEKDYPSPEEPTHFVMLLRKHLEGGIITRLQQGGLDRYLTFEIHMRNEIGDKATRYLYVELMGKYANVILCDETNRIIDALKRIPPFENTKRTIQPGAIYRYPDPHENKKNPFITDLIDNSRSLTQQFHGFSPLLSQEFEYRMHSGQTFNSIIAEINASHSVYITHIQEEIFFHCIPLKHLEGNPSAYPFMQGMDVLYFHKEEKERIKQQTGDLFKFVKRELKKLQQKLPKLNESLEEAIDCDKWREYGDLLYAYAHLVKKGETVIDLNSFDESQTLSIPIDSKLDGKHNAKKYFQKYTKGKKGQAHILKQIELCENEINYFQTLQEQLEIAGFIDAKEIREELIQLNYLKALKTKRKPKKTKPIPAFSTLNLPNGLMICYGKNNLQNDYLTFKHAKKSDLWFHTKDFHGSHVILNTDQPDEQTLRLAAQIAAYFSKGRYGSSVPVNYCLVKNLKKVPGAKSGFASLSTYKTIYIDPDYDLIESLI